MSTYCKRLFQNTLLTLKTLLNRGNHKHLALQMGTMHGLPQKFGQILALKNMDNQSDDYDPLTNINAASINPLPFARFKSLLEDSIEDNAEKIFSQIDKNGIAASIGQVHKATLLDGSIVAIKIQYPHIKSLLDADLKTLGLLSAPLSRKRKGFALNEYREELKDSLYHEIDYLQESKNTILFQKLCKGIDFLNIPNVYKNLSNEHLLVTEWIEGFSIREAQDLNPAQRKIIAQTLLEFYLRSWLVWGKMHADPHQGNFIFSFDLDNNPVTNIIDFGCVKKIPAQVHNALKLLLTVDTNENSKFCVTASRALSIFTELGFNRDLLVAMQEKLPAVIRLLQTPFRHGDSYNIKDFRIQNDLQEILGEDRWNFRFAGPASLILFIRSFQGMLIYLKALDVELDYRAILEETIRDNIPVEINENQPETSMKKSLHIKVIKNGEQLVKLKLPETAIENLPDLLPEDMDDVLVSQGIDVEQITADLIKNNHPCGDVFTLNNDNKVIRIWIEEE